MKLHTLLASLACAVAPSAFAHPGHGTTPAFDGGKSHIHFGAAQTPSPKLAGKVPAVRKDVAPAADEKPRPTALHARPDTGAAANKAIRRER